MTDVRRDGDSTDVRRAGDSSDVRRTGNSPNRWSSEVETTESESADAEATNRGLSLSKPTSETGEADATPRRSSEVETREATAYDGAPGRVPEDIADRVPEEGRDPVSKGPQPSEQTATHRRSSEVETPLDLTNAVGVGIDVVGITAFAEQLAEPGTRFARAFTPGERRAARSGEGSEAESLAARWAAKEAVIKAWSSTRFGHPEVIDPAHVDLREIEVRTDAWGRPAVRLHGAIADSMSDYSVLVSLSHDAAADVAAAFVVLQQRCDT